MKKSLVVLMMAIAISAFLAGCGSVENPLLGTADKEAVTADKGSVTTDKEAVETLADLAEAQQKIAETYDENDPEAVVKMMETYAEYGAKLELQEFEKTESLDPPSDFPSGLIYNKGKITESSDSGDESYINKSVTMQTTDDVKIVKSFYKDLFSQLTWKLTSQSNESGGASYDATDSANIEAYVYISSDPYSKIVSISITYSGSITE
ncbi:MAG: hypothetical protein WC285_04695 [Candidatus Gracilibacteria bacterium]